MTPARSAFLTTEAKVGLLFFVGLGVTLWFTIFVGRIGGGNGGYEVRFDRVAGISAGSPVAYNGVRIGTVRSVVPVIGADSRPEIAVRFDIEPEVRAAVLVAEDARIRISQGLLGGAALEIVSANGQPVTATALARLRGEAPVGLGETFDALGNVVSENREDLRRAIAALPGAVENFSGMSESIRDLVQENRIAVNEAVVAFRNMSRSVDTLVTDNRQAVNDAIVRFEQMSAQIRDLVAENRAGVKGAVDQLPAAVERFTQAASQVRDLIAENREAVATALGNFASFSPKLDRIGSDLEKITAQIASGQGTVGRLVFEETVHERAVSALDGLAQRAEEIKPFTSGFSDLKFWIGAEAGVNTERETLRGKAIVRIEPRPWKFYQVGIGYLYDFSGKEFDEDPDDLGIDIDITLGWRFWRDEEAQRYLLSVRGGLIESAFGTQVDWSPWGPFTISAMARAKRDFDEDDRRFEGDDNDSIYVRAWAEWRVWRGWSLLAGVDDLAEEAAPWIGIRAEILDNDIRNLTTAAGIVP